MAMIFRVRYPGGEEVWATGYPDQVVVLQEVPRGPEACYLDKLEVDWTGYTGATSHPVFPVRRIVGGPRRPTTHPRLDGDRDAWMEARDAEGWETRDDDVDPHSTRAACAE